MPYFWDVWRRRVAVFLIRIAFKLAHIQAINRDKALAASKYELSVETLHIPSKDRARNIEVHLYKPPVSPGSTVSPKPVIVNWHGSGWTIPFHGSDIVFSARVARELDAYVIDADYRKAPENPFPAALDDVRDVLNWVATQPERFDASRVAVSGASAGGTLALIASSTLRKSFKVDIKAVFAHYPVTDLSLRAEDRIISHPINPLPPSVLELFYSNYVTDSSMRKDPRISPMYAKVEDYPTTVVIIASGGDTLSVEAKKLAQKLDDGSRKVTCCTWPGTRHGYDVGETPGRKDWSSRDKAYSMVLEAFGEALRGM